VRSRPATIPPAGTRRFAAASPYGPAGTSHRRGSPSRGVIRGSLTFAHHPQTAGSRPRAGKHPLPADLLLAHRHRMEQQRLRLRPRASHPAVTHDARRGGDGPSRTGPGTTPRPQPPSMAPPTSLMRPHVAPSHRSPPTPPRVIRQRGSSPRAGSPGRWRSAPSPGAVRSRSSAPAPTGADADPSPQSAVLRTIRSQGPPRIDGVSTPSMSRESRGAEAPLLHRIRGSAVPVLDSNPVGTRPWACHWT
jgi:hypothetical protein